MSKEYFEIENLKTRWKAMDIAEQFAYLEGCVDANVEAHPEADPEFVSGRVMKNLLTAMDEDIEAWQRAVEVRRVEEGWEA